MGKTKKNKIQSKAEKKESKIRCLSLSDLHTHTHTNTQTHKILSEFTSVKYWQTLTKITSNVQRRVQSHEAGQYLQIFMSACSFSSNTSTSSVLQQYLTHSIAVVLQNLTVARLIKDLPPLTVFIKSTYLRSSPKTHQGRPGALKVVTKHTCIIRPNYMQPVPGAALSSPYLFSRYRGRRSVTEPYSQTGRSFFHPDKTSTHCIWTFNSFPVTNPSRNFGKHNFFPPFLLGPSHVPLGPKEEFKAWSS
jgi:hypothetical protein